MTGQAESGPFDLKTLLAPFDLEGFSRDHWERKPLHVGRRDAHHYDSLLTNVDLERIISSPDLRYPAIQLAKNGSYLAPEVYTKNIKHGSEFFNGVADLGQIQSEYRSGATVVLPALQRTWSPLGKLCATLENELSHAVHANAYLTPGDSPGFTPHYDTHEVFVLQIAGKKWWRVFEPPLPLPHRTQPFTPVGYALPAPILELELCPGDLLYLPRGYVHAAKTSRGHSAHITIGMTVYTWVELLSEVIAASRDLAAFRTALPPGFAARDDLKRALREGLGQCLERLRSDIDSDRVIESFVRKVHAAKVHPVAAFNSDERVIGLETTLMAPEAGQYRILLENRSAVLEFDGKKLILPDQIRPTIDDMCSRRAFQPKELCGPLDNAAKLSLARYLHDERFLRMVD